MRSVTRCAALLALLLCLLLPLKTKALSIRHYLGGWTRTTWYVPYAPPNRTASGIWPYWGTLAAPYYIPFGAHVHIPGLGVFLAADRGGAIWGNHLDIFMDYPGEHYVADYYKGVWWSR